MPSTRKYAIGQGIQYDWEIRDPTIAVTREQPDLNLVDPAGGLQFSLSGAGLAAPLVFVYLTDPELVRVSTGRYRLLRAHDAPGNLRWRWESFGDYLGSDQDTDLILDTNQ